METVDQLKQWVKGNSVHNTERDECCPDFSCCHKGMVTDLETRERFFKAHRENDKATQNEMLMMFLGKAFATANVYIAGGEQGNEH